MKSEFPSTVHPATDGPIRWLRVLGVFSLGALCLLSTAPVALADNNEAASPGVPSNVSDFDASSIAGVVDFQLLYDRIFLPYKMVGGIFESISAASSTGNAQGIAGAMPIPLVATMGAVFPTNDPITGQPTPKDLREGYQRIDWSRLPTYCKSEYPDTYGEGRDDVYCGGPAAEDPRLGFTAGVVNGHSKSSGSYESPLQAKSVSTSRAKDITIPGAQIKIYSAWSQTTAGLNHDGVPEGRAVAQVERFELLNGLVKLAGVRSEAVATATGTEEGTAARTSFDVAEAYVGGIPVSIGRDGVTVRGEQLVPGREVQAAAKQVSDMLAAADLVIRLVPPPAVDKQGTRVSGQSGGIEIIHRGATLTHADSYYRLGFVSAAANAVQATGYGEPSTETSSGSEGGVLPDADSSADTTSIPAPSIGSTPSFTAVDGNIGAATAIPPVSLDNGVSESGAAFSLAGGGDSGVLTGSPGVPSPEGSGTLPSPEAAFEPGGGRTTLQALPAAVTLAADGVARVTGGLIALCGLAVGGLLIRRVLV